MPENVEQPEMTLDRMRLIELWGATGRRTYELFHELEAHGLNDTWGFLLYDIAERLRASGTAPPARPAPLEWATVRDGCCDDWPVACNYHLGWLEGATAVLHGLEVVAEFETDFEALPWDIRVLMVERQAVNLYRRSKEG